MTADVPSTRPPFAGAIAAELNVAGDGRVLDLAAGTGKLTRALAAAGYDVVAVEPQAPLREILGRTAGVQVRDGVAEAIPLPDSSVDAVTVADGFHWFDQAAAAVEIARVLRPGGGLAVLDTVPDWGGASWAHEVGTLLSGLRPAHPHFDGPPWQDALRAAGGWREPWEVTVLYEIPASAERVLDHLLSMSWIAALPAAERDQRMSQIAAVMAAGQTPASFPIRAQIGLSARLVSGRLGPRDAEAAGQPVRV